MRQKQDAFDNIQIKISFNEHTMEQISDDREEKQYLKCVKSGLPWQSSG